MITKYLVTYETIDAKNNLCTFHTIYNDTYVEAIDTAQTIYREQLEDNEVDDGVLNDDSVEILKCVWDIEEELADVIVYHEEQRPDSYALLWSARYSIIDIFDLTPQTKGGSNNC